MDLKGLCVCVCLYMYMRVTEEERDPAEFSLFNNSRHLHCTYYVPGMVLFHVINHLILIATLWDRYYCFSHFADEEFESQRSKSNLTRSHTQYVEKLGLKLRYNLGVHTPDRNLHVVIMVKNMSTNAGDKRDTGLIPGLERSSGEENAAHSSILAWRIPWTEEPGGLQSMGSWRVGDDWRDLPYLEESQYALLVLLRKWLQKDAVGLTEKCFWLSKLEQWSGNPSCRRRLPMAIALELQLEFKCIVIVGLQ